MESPTGIDERSWFLAVDKEDYAYVCFADGERQLVRRYEHEEEMTDCILVMLFELAYLSINLHVLKKSFFFSSLWKKTSLFGLR